MPQNHKRLFQILTLLKDLQKAIENDINQSISNFEIILKINTTISKIKFLTEQEKQLHTDPFIIKIQEIIIDNIGNPLLTVDFIARSVFLDRTQVYRKIKSKIGISPSAWINNLRMELAVELIITMKTQSISSIATACGYCDISYFGKVFKKTFGITPSNFRKNKGIRVTNKIFKSS